MSEYELAGWIAYYRLEPWGPERADWNAGMIASVLVNLQRDPKRRPEPFTPQDFMPKYGGSAESDQERMMEPEQILAAFDGLIRAQERRQQVLRRNGAG